MELNSQGLYQSSGKGKESCCLVLPSSTKRELRHFHVVVMQRRPRNAQHSVMHVQSCCFAKKTYSIFFLPFSLPSPSSLRLKLPNMHGKRDTKNIHRDKDKGIEEKMWIEMTGSKTPTVYPYFTDSVSESMTVNVRVWMSTKGFQIRLD